MYVYKLWTATTRCWPGQQRPPRVKLCSHPSSYSTVYEYIGRVKHTYIQICICMLYGLRLFAAGESHSGVAHLLLILYMNVYLDIYTSVYT